MNILVTNVYSYKNKGDAAIVISLIREIYRVFGVKVDVAVQTTDVQNDIGKYGVPVSSTLLWILLSSVRDRNILARFAVLCKGVIGLNIYLLCNKYLKSKPYFLLSTELKQYVREIEAASLVIACGGGYLRTSGSGMRETLLLYITSLNFLTAKYLGKEVYLYSQSIGPVHSKLQNTLLKRALDKVDLVEPREDVSLKLIRAYELKTKVELTADPALLLGDTAKVPHDIVKLNHNRLNVGLTVRQWFKDPADFEKYLNSMSTAIDYLISKYNAHITYVPQVIADNFGDDDRLTAMKVWKKVKYKKEFTVVKADLHPYEVIGLCSKMDIFVGTRMHSNIFALISHVPVVGIEYEHKTRGIMRGLGLEELVIDIKDVDEQTLKSKIDQVILRKDEFKELIKRNLPAQIADSQKAMELIGKMHDRAVGK
ncbi:polysaccharide pyruvyl transferase family protein [Candidatus Saccharibacteria bacterium]|nr:polysaccharide pyruvyl transferase family protein [Candidatus Saccharibacteria bacterium]